MRQLTLIELNGLYDIICAFCIYNPIIPIINDLHISLFRKELMTPLTKRIMAQWILLYGIIRLTHSYHKNPTLVTATYIIEGTTFLSEMIIYSTIDKTKINHTAFTIICSFAFSCYTTFLIQTC